jgi:hypothetical protein
MATDLQRAFAALKAKSETYTQLFDYYDGNQPLMYTAKRLEEIFRDLDAKFIENWCSVVVDSLRDKINLTQIKVPDLLADTWQRLWYGSELKLESDAVHEAALITGEAFVVAWPDAEGMMQAYYNDPRLCHVFYNAEYPRVKEFAAKWWVEDDGTYRLTLYYPDRLEYYRTNDKSANEPSAFLPDGEEAVQTNVFGIIPVFHFRINRRKNKGDLANVIPVQNGINKLLTDMMVAAEYGAFKQRYIISSAETGGKMKNAPNAIWDIPAGDGIGQQTQVGQFDATPLDNYLKAINDLSMAISSITRTPKHYFFSIGSNLSGDALDAMEQPLNKKAQDRIDCFVPEWQRLAVFMLGGMISEQDVDVRYDKPELVQPLTQAQTRQANVQAGMPLVTALREEGKSQDFIDQMANDAEAVKAQEQVSLGQAMLAAQRRFDQGQNTESSKTL